MLITSLVLKAKARPKKYKKERYAIGNVSKKDPSNIIREFDKLPYVGQYPRSKLGTRRVVNKGVLCGIDRRQTGMRAQ